jgi:hypothetical protein
MTLRFYHDPDTDLPHIYNHGVHEQEVQDVLRYPMEDAKSDRGSRMAIGRTRAGRYLKVIYVPENSAMESSSSLRTILSASLWPPSVAECAGEKDEQAPKNQQKE